MRRRRAMMGRSDNEHGHLSFEFYLDEAVSSISSRLAAMASCVPLVRTASRIRRWLLNRTLSNDGIVVTIPLSLLPLRFQRSYRGCCWKFNASNVDAGRKVDLPTIVYRAGRSQRKHSKSCIPQFALKYWYA